ncbi:MAG: hypothetical protein RI949_3135, partial [Pseudomonadota bacterium]
MAPFFLARSQMGLRLNSWMRLRSGSEADTLCLHHANQCHSSRLQFASRRRSWISCISSLHNMKESSQ